MEFIELCRAASNSDVEGDIDPYPTLAWLRSELPVSKVPGPDGVDSVWFVTSHELVQACLSDPRLSFDPRNARESHPAGREPYLLAKDAPDHTRLRRVVSAAFGPGALERLRPSIMATCQRHITTFAERGEADLLAEYAWYIPEAAISTLLGIPDELRLPAGRGTTLTLAATLLEQTSGGPATDELWAYVDMFLTARARRPGTDLTGVLLAAVERGELSADEASGMAYVLYTTAQFSTAALVATALLHILADPAERSRRPSGPRGWRPVVEETLRHASPVQSTMPRYALTELELGGEQIAQGDAVVLSTAGANRDPSRFDRPDEFHAESKRRTTHLGFGYGAHFCLGAPLARLEAEIALDTLFRVVPSVRLAVRPEEITWGLGPMLRYPRAVPVSFDPNP